MEQNGRKIFLHDIPPWIDPEACEYFITVCCKQRGANQLCLPDTGAALLDTVRFYRAREKWFPWRFLLMPDHVHMIVSFGREQRHLGDVVSAWKRYTATKQKVVWQQGFFEHRLRRHESAQEKADYILQNPVRAGLAREPCEWPFLLQMHD